MAKRLAILCFLFCVVHSPLVLADPPRVHIDHVLEQFIVAFNNGDAATMASLYTVDATLMPPDASIVRGRAAVQAFWQAGIDGGMKIDYLRATEVEAHGDLAYEVGEFKVLVPSEDGTAEAFGKYIVIWKREGHSWLVHHDIWNSDPAGE